MSNQQLLKVWFIGCGLVVALVIASTPGCGGGKKKETAAAKKDKDNATELKDSTAKEVDPKPAGKESPPKKDLPQKKEKPGKKELPRKKEPAGTKETPTGTKETKPSKPAIEVPPPAQKFDVKDDLNSIVVKAFEWQRTSTQWPVNRLDTSKKPLLSWRVTINKSFFFAEDQSFDLKQAWDTKENIKAAGKAADVFNRLDKKGPQGIPLNTVMTFCGPGTLFDGRDQPSTAAVKDGVSTTIYLVDVSPEKAAPWSQPIDVDFDPKNPIAGLGSLPAGGFHAATFDGHVKFIKKDIDPQVLKGLITIDGGEKVELPAD